MNLSDLQTQLRISVGNPLATDVTDETLRAMINLAYKEVADKYRFHKTRRICTLTTEADIDKYTLPTGTNLVFRAKNRTNGENLIKLTDQDFSVLNTPASQTGAPCYFARYRDYIQFYPIPDGEYVIEVFYQFGVTSLSDPAEEPVLPEAWHKGILLMARYNYFDLVKLDVPKAAAAQNAYGIWLRDKPVEVHEESAAGDFGVSLPTLAESRYRAQDDGW